MPAKLLESLGKMADSQGKEGDETLLMRRAARPSSREAGFTLHVLEGPDKGKALVIDANFPSRVLVGQSPSCEFKLTDRQVSRRHLACESAGERLRVTDLQSLNGTTVNGVSLGEAYLRGGERVELGSTVILIELSRAAEDVPLPTATKFGRTVGASAAMRKLYPLCKRLAQTDVAVIIEGETGTGKEVLAESLHEQSPRASGPFVVFDCTAVPPNLVESALFGHERGSFTGATETRRGVFEEAHGGTLLIDEIGDLDIDLQAKLLRVLERSEVRRIGGSRFIKVDVRILAATRRNLDEEVAAGRFRDDLFFRLAVTRIELPPLRHRKGDIATLARHFWKRISDPGTPIPDGFLERLEAYGWPGNVRELQNAVARRVALGDLAMDDVRISESLAPTSDVTAPVSSAGADSTIERILGENLPLPRARQKLVSEFERRYVERVLELHGGNVARAAEASGIARRYFRLLRAKLREQQDD
ncbi:MAG: sigma 54-interacting transcriptional regulator [Polyangiaceae bacterium]